MLENSEFTGLYRSLDIDYLNDFFLQFIFWPGVTNSYSEFVFFNLKKKLGLHLSWKKNTCIVSEPCSLCSLKLRMIRKIT